MKAVVVVVRNAQSFGPGITGNQRQSVEVARGQRHLKAVVVGHITISQISDVLYVGEPCEIVSAGTAQNIRIRISTGAGRPDCIAAGDQRRRPTASGKRLVEVRLAQEVDAVVTHIG